MRQVVVRTAALASLLAVAGACAFLAYRALATRARTHDPWADAIAAARRADGTKGVLPALRARDRAIARFNDLARTGTPAARSHAKLLAGLMQVRNAGAQADPTQSLALAVAELQGAVRLDRANDDAAYDLELLLSRSAQAGHPIGSPRPEKKKSPGRAGTAPPGTGY
jgi:hypothetical protein